MKPEEAIEILSLETRIKIRDAIRLAIEALEEISLYKNGKLCLVPDGVYEKQCKELDEYKEIGTVEDIKKTISILSMSDDDLITKDFHELYEYRKIGTVEECREAVEKQKAKKPDIYTDTRNMVDLHGNVYAEQANVYLCPTCESFIGYVGNNIFHYCPVCGQAIDENLEGMEYE